MSGVNKGFVHRCVEELGLKSLYQSTRDIKLLCLQRFVRLFAYGASTLVLVAFLEGLGHSKTKIGLFMTLTLWGDVCISFVLTLFADGLGRKAILAVGAALMAGSGIVFALFGNYWILLAAAVFGVISPAGNEIGPFRAIEESVVGHLTSSAHRSDIYAWYSLLGTAGAAFGVMASGWVVHYLIVERHWEELEAYRIIFYGYAALGVLKLVLALMLSSAVEAEKRQQKPRDQSGTNGETTPLLSESSAGGNAASAVEQSEPKRGIRTLLPEISKESRSILISLCFLFAVDSFASGLASLSWMTFFFKSHYGVEEGRLGSIFFTTSLISAGSMLVASSLAKRFGNVNTMVFTHLPSSVFLGLIGVPNNVHLSLVFLILRHCTSSMDVAPRAAFMAAIVLPQERTAIMGIVVVVKTTAQSLGPLITGVLVDRNLFWVAFILAGSLKACYDLGMLVLFKEHEREKAERERLAAQRRGQADEEEGETVNG